MRILIFGLPGSGKTTLAKEIASQLPCLYLNGDRVRALFQDNDFSLDGRHNQARRMKALADMAGDILVIADFVCPTNETRKIFDADLLIWMNTINDCKYSDTNKIFEKPDTVDIEITLRDANANAKHIMQRIKELEAWA